jgi:osmotically-inducible protein OsmY
VKPDAEIREDAEIRGDVTGELHWDPQVWDPAAVGVAVKDEAVILTGAVSTYGEGLAAVRAASRVYGVKAVVNNITVASPASPDRVVTEIEEAFRREAEVDARHIQVEMSDHTAELYGLVHPLSEAAAVPVVGRVESHLVVSP